jgi:hypothetical protein
VTEHWSEERERQVLKVFLHRKPRIKYLASCRCPHDGRLLGAISHLTDGIWIWQAGSRLSPKMAHDEFRGHYLDCFDETELCEEVYEQASEYADEELQVWRGRLETDPSVMKIIVDGYDEPIRVADHDSPDTRRGLPIVHLVTCGCRRHHLLPVLELISLGLRADTGLIKPDAHIHPRPIPALGQPSRINQGERGPL